MTQFAPIEGKDKILFARLLSDAKAKKASKILYQVEHTINYSNTSEVKQTKDGNLQQSSGLETTVDLTAVLTNDDTNKMLRDAVKKGEPIELWEVNLKSIDEEGKAEALYMQAKLNEWADPATVGEYSEFSTTANVVGEPQAGEVTITQEDYEDIQYTFRDLNAHTPEA